MMWELISSSEFVFTLSVIILGVVVAWFFSGKVGIGIRGFMVVAKVGAVIAIIGFVFMVYICIWHSVSNS